MSDDENKHPGMTISTGPAELGRPSLTVNPAPKKKSGDLKPEDNESETKTDKDGD